LYIRGKITGMRRTKRMWHGKVGFTLRAEEICRRREKKTGGKIEDNVEVFCDALLQRESAN